MIYTANNPRFAKNSAGRYKLQGHPKQQGRKGRKL